MTLHQFLKNRVAYAKSFSKAFRDEVTQCIKDYECDADEMMKRQGSYDKLDVKRRYVFPIPYIYSTHESMLASLFEKAPELIMTGKGAKDETKANLLRSIYEYLYDKLDLEQFLIDSAWWFLLIGFTSSYQAYKIEISGEVPAQGVDGQPLLDEDGNPVTQPTYAYHDPIAVVDDPFKCYFAPDSKFSNDAEGVPYIVREQRMETEEIEKIYGIAVEADQEIDVAAASKKTEEERDDLKRATVYLYEGKISPAQVDDLPSLVQVEEQFGITIQPDTTYYVALASEKILHIEEKTKHCALARWFATPNKFFGFGLGKTLRTYQNEMSIRRGQQVRYADLHANPWLMLDAKTQVDQKAIMDVYKRTPLTYNGQPPSYLVPPTMPSTMTDADNIARSDAQFVSGTLDLSKGAQETNTVKTATGQQLFAKSQDRRTEKVRAALGKYFRQVVINLFEEARDNWDDGKVITITDEDGNGVEMGVDKAELRDIDFDTDIDIQLSNIAMNDDTIAQRAIDLYDKVKDDPFVDRKEIFNYMLKTGYKIKNPDKYALKQDEVGTQQTQQDGTAPGEQQEGGQPDQETGESLLGNQMAPNPLQKPDGYTQ